LPNTGEMIGTVTETQWFLALCAFLLILAKPPDSLGRKIFDIALLLLSGFTGPFCFVLLLIAVTLPKAATGRWRRVVTGIFLAGSTVQLCELILNHSHRYSLALGATPQLFIQILGSQVYFGTLLGSNVLASMLPLKVVLVAIIAGSLIVACGGILSPVMRRFILLTAILFLAALASPTTAQFPGKSAWQLLARSPGARYWFLPTLTFAWSIAFCLQSKKQLLRIAAFPLAVVMLFGIVRNYRCPAFADTQFAQNVAHFQTLPKGSKQSIQVTPAEWKMVLIKR
ncbi:hypothetical protein, partial [Edaphobacter sp.]|uniref:hypothetical protein n=1 Tax=Edaphobacter sp. TaxID=1934404 RepID=UPI002DBABC62